MSFVQQKLILLFPIVKSAPITLSVHHFELLLAAEVAEERQLN